jgi:CheY-like chemotaxis protein
MRDEYDVIVSGFAYGGTMAARILLVDDDRELRDTVQILLKSAGYDVVEVADCDSALHLLAHVKFDLILLDITLPDKSGLRVLEFVKDRGLFSKVIVVTGTVGLETAITSSNLGAKNYITKPYNPGYLLKAIEHVLSDQSGTNQKLQIIKAGDFIVSSPTGDLDLIASRRALAEIAATGARLQEYGVLLDLRDIKSHLSLGDLYELASELAGYGTAFRRKTALLARDDMGFDQAIFFETAAQDRGFDVKSFTFFEDAVRWLSQVSFIETNHSNGQSLAHL